MLFRTDRQHTGSACQCSCQGNASFHIRHPFLYEMMGFFSKAAMYGCFNDSTAVLKEAGITPTGGMIYNRGGSADSLFICWSGSCIITGIKLPAAAGFLFLILLKLSSDCMPGSTPAAGYSRKEVSFLGFIFCTCNGPSLGYM